MKRWVTNIEYKGEPDIDFEDELRSLACEHGGQRDGSSYYFPGNARDVAYWFRTERKAALFLDACKVSHLLLKDFCGTLYSETGP